MNKVIRIPADHSPETIADVFSIVVSTTDKGTGHIHNKIVHLEGTVEEKLQQYKDATGKDWNGFDEQVFTAHDDTKPVSLNLGNAAPKLLARPDPETQAKIDALTAQAEKWIEESREAKRTWVTPKEVETLHIT
jgi:hypothetical protein